MLQDLLETEAWRMTIPSYAARMSRGNWIPYPWLIYMLGRVQRALARGNARIIISAPPRHGKSESVSFWLPAWYLDWFPEHRIISTSYGESLALQFAAKVRGHFLSNEHVWTTLDPKQTRLDDWATTKGGGMRSTGILGSITGRGANLLLIDDPHKDEFEAASFSQRNKVIDAFKSTLYTRLEPGGSIIVIQTRWHELDLAGWLEEESSDEWEVIKLPAMAEDNDPLGRAVGAPLCPERRPLEELEAIRRLVGEFRWACLYQQRPAPLEGGIIRQNWFNTYKKLNLDDMNEWLMGWDFSFSETGGSYVVGQVWARKGPDYYLIDQFRDKVDFPDSVRAVERMIQKWPQAKTRVVENKANGAAVLATMKKQFSGFVPYEPKGDKETRLSLVSHLFEAGNVWVPERKPWLDAYITELTVFPNSANDDQVDVTSMCLGRMLKNSEQLTNIKLTQSGYRPSQWDFS